MAAEPSKEGILKETNSEGIKGALSLDYSGDSNKKFYKDWAKTYDDDVNGEKYMAPVSMADILESLIKEHYAGQKPAVIDMGCGTGLVGEVVRSRLAKGEASEMSVFDGFDISAEMIEAADAKKVHDRSWGDVDLTVPCVGQGNGDLKEAMYDIGLACGVWTLGHVTPECIPYAMALIKPGGLLVISVRMSYSAEHGFDAAARKAAESAGGKVIDVRKNQRYIEAEGADFYVIQTKA